MDHPDQRYRPAALYRGHRGRGEESAQISGVSTQHIAATKTTPETALSHQRPRLPRRRPERSLSAPDSLPLRLIVRRPTGALRAVHTIADWSSDCSYLMSSTEKRKRHATG